MTAWTLANDANDVPTLWHGDTAVLRPADLRVPRKYADALFGVLVAVYTRPDEAVERVAETVYDSADAPGWHPWEHQREQIREYWRVYARAALQALAAPPDVWPAVADGNHVDYVQAAHVADAATALEWTERLGEPVGEADSDG